MQRFPMTKEGYIKLKAEFDHLKAVVRPQVINEVATARAHGDLKENAEYHAAREKQSFVEGRIQELEGKLGAAEVIDPSTLSTERVVFGMTVEVLDLDADTTKTYRLVGEDESDLPQGKISYKTPLAKALIGKEIDDEVTVNTPGGTRTLQILSITK
ncbi:MAG: transcription elongation factor GreA [Deltaproteobacteria bacterium RIFOXYA12_FULL_61_11]|nr:MAG: transcription elongation factor GreA [Deltaproteobacteria bacterium RIFOXYA12_FULL_61_11]